MANEKRLDLIDREKVYENACAGCTRHGEKPGECYHDEPCERLIFEFTVSEPVDAVEVVRCKDCKWFRKGKPFRHECKKTGGGIFYPNPDDFCSYGERKTDNGRS